MKLEAVCGNQTLQLNQADGNRKIIKLLTAPSPTMWHTTGAPGLIPEKVTVQGGQT